MSFDSYNRNARILLTHLPESAPVLESSSMYQSRFFTTENESTSKAAKKKVALKPSIGQTNKIISQNQVKIFRDDTKCLKIIESTTRALYSDEDYATTLNKFLEVIDNPNKQNLTKQCKLLVDLLSNLKDSSTEELEELKENLKWPGMLYSKSLKKLFVKSSSIKHTGFLDSGGFSIVRSGYLTKDGKNKAVALKSAKAGRFVKHIVSEAYILSQLDHKNILKILAFDNEDTLEIALEMMSLGNLTRATQNLQFTNINVLRILTDVAEGMEYLHNKNILHRDLACRNIFLNKAKECKIGDFGLSVYVGDSDGVYLETEYSPDACNISPETDKSKIFTKQNDVWAMGVLIWQLFQFVSLSVSPAYSKLLIFQFRDSHQKLPKPIRCSTIIYEYTIQNVLHRDSMQRPSFGEIKTKLQEIMARKKYIA